MCGCVRGARREIARTEIAILLEPYDHPKPAERGDADEVECADRQRLEGFAPAPLHTWRGQQARVRETRVPRDWQPRPKSAGRPPRLCRGTERGQQT